MRSCARSSRRFKIKGLNRSKNVKLKDAIFKLNHKTIFNSKSFRLNGLFINLSKLSLEIE